MSLIPKFDLDSETCKRIEINVSQVDQIKKATLGQCTHCAWEGVEPFMIFAATIGDHGAMIEMCMRCTWEFFTSGHPAMLYIFKKAKEAFPWVGKEVERAGEILSKLPKKNDR